MIVAYSPVFSGQPFFDFPVPIITSQALYQGPYLITEPTLFDVLWIDGETFPENNITANFLLKLLHHRPFMCGIDVIDGHR